MRKKWDFEKWKKHIDHQSRIKKKKNPVLKRSRVKYFKDVIYFINKMKNIPNIKGIKCIRLKDLTPRRLMTTVNIMKRHK